VFRASLEGYDGLDRTDRIVSYFGGLEFNMSFLKLTDCNLLES
jgi:hypothetical protein